MNDDKWKDVLAKISENFEIENQETRELSEEEGLGEIEIVEFDGPLGKMRLERTTQPLVLDRKSIGSKRIGSDKVIQYTYSDTEKVHRFKAYKWDDAQNDWEEMQMDRGEMMF